MKLARLLCSFALLTSYTLSIFSPDDFFIQSASAQTSDKANASADAICKSIEDLVRQFYPKAKISRSDNQIHFEFKTKMEMVRYSMRPVPVPSDGGILGDIQLKQGSYNGQDKDRLPSEEPDGFHTTLTMAPREENCYLLARLIFPQDIPFQFKEQFKDIVRKFATNGSSNQGSAPAQDSRAPQDSIASRGSGAPSDSTQSAQLAQSAATPVQTGNSIQFKVPAKPPGAATSETTESSAQKQENNESEETKQALSKTASLSSGTNDGAAKTPISEPASKKYKLDLHRASVVGTKYRIIRSASQTIDAYADKTLVKRINVERYLDGVMTIMEIDKRKNDTKQSWALTKLLDNGKQVLPPGTVLTLEKINGKDVCRIAGRTIPPETQKLLSEIFHLPDADSPDSNEIFGTNEPQPIGGKWTLNSDAITKVFTKDLPGAKASGSARLSKIAKVNDLDCYVIDCELVIQGNDCNGTLRGVDYFPVDTTLQATRSAIEGVVNRKVGKLLAVIKTRSTSDMKQLNKLPAIAKARHQ